MAIVLSGRTRCVSCGEIIQADDEALGLPQLNIESSNRYWKYMDAACHLRCEGNPDVQDYLKYAMGFR